MNGNGIFPVMDTSQAPTDDILKTLDISGFTSSSITLEWRLGGKSANAIDGFQVHYQKAASTYIQYGPMLTATATKYIIRNLVADTYYKVCLVTYRNATSPIRECVDASTSNWHLPVSIESSIGAVLALSFIVIIVLLTRCRLPLKYKRKMKKDKDRYDTISTNYPDDQYDFSDTTTQGHEDDLVSNPDESAVLGETKDHSKGRRGTCERLCNGNPNPGFTNSYGQHRKTSSPAVFITEEDSHHHESKDHKSHRKSSIFAQDKHHHHHHLHHHIPLPLVPFHESGNTSQRAHWKNSPNQILLYKCKSERAKHELQYEAPIVYPLNDPRANYISNKKSGDEFYFTDKPDDILFIDDSPPPIKGHTLQFQTRGKVNETYRQKSFSREPTLDTLEDNFETCDGAVGGVPDNTLDPYTDAQYWHEMDAVEMSVRDGIVSLPDMDNTDEHAL